MKRSIAAASLLALAGAGQAQNVTIYGVIDQAVEHLTNMGADGHTDNRLPGLTGSVPTRIGFRGSEDLGGGLRALFTIEQGFGADAGTLNQGGRAWGRQAWVGLAGDWGQLSLGRQYSMLFFSQLDADILGPNMYGSASLDSYLPNARVDNAVGYKGTFSGFTLGATYSFGRDAVNAGPSPSGTNCPGEVAGDANACRQWSLLAKYDAAAWGVALAVDQIRGGAGAFGGLTSSALKDRRATVDGWVKFDALKLGAGLIRRDNDGNAATPKSDLWYLGAAYAVTPNVTLDGELFKLKFKDSANAATLLALRGTYALSKRTAVYVTAGHVGNDGALAASVTNAAAGSNPAAGESQNGFAAGVKHSF